MQGLLDFLKTPEGQGLLATGLGAAASAGRGRGLLGNIGAGGLMGLQTYSGAQEAERRQAEDAQQREVRGLQLRKMRADMSDEDLARTTAQQFFTPGRPAAGGALDGSLPAEFQTGAAPVPAQAPKFDMQGYAQARMSQNPVAGMQLMQQLQKDTPFGKIDPKDYSQESIAKFAQTRNFADLQPARKMEVAGNGQVFDPYRVQPGQVFTNPNQPFAVGADGQPVANEPFQKFSLAKAAAGASRNSNTVITKQETEEGKTVGKFFGDSYADIQKAGMNGQSSINRFGRLGQLLDGVDTGKFAPLGLEVAKTAQSLGLKVDPNLANKEAAVALSSELALQLRNPAGGAGMPGAMSDKDREFLASMVPGIEKTPEGRRMILETGKKLAQRDIEVARMAREYRKNHGSINEGFYDELARHAEANPLFQGAAPAAAPSAAPQATMRWDPQTNKLVQVR